VVKPAVDGGPINLAAMTNLRTLTLPGDAILPTRYVPHRVSTSSALLTLNHDLLILRETTKEYL